MIAPKTTLGSERSTYVTPQTTLRMPRSILGSLKVLRHHSEAEPLRRVNIADHPVGIKKFTCSRLAKRCDGSQQFGDGLERSGFERSMKRFSDGFEPHLERGCRLCSKKLCPRKQAEQNQNALRSKTRPRILSPQRRVFAGPIKKAARRSRLLGNWFRGS